MSLKLSQYWEMSDFLALLPTFWRLAQWRISEHKTVNTPQKLMRGRMFRHYPAIEPNACYRVGLLFVRMFYSSPK
jgi:hypothetical protein